MDITPSGSQPVSFDNKAITTPVIARDPASLRNPSKPGETAPVQDPAAVDDGTKSATEKLKEQNIQLEDIVDSANRNMGILSDSLVFNLNRDLDRVVVQLVDNSSKEVIRQYPSEEMVEVYTALKKLSELLLPKGANGSMGTDDSASGVLLKTRA